MVSLNQYRRSAGLSCSWLTEYDWGATDEWGQTSPTFCIVDKKRFNFVVQLVPIHQRFEMLNRLVIINYTEVNISSRTVRGHSQQIPKFPPISQLPSAVMPCTHYNLLLHSSLHGASILHTPYSILLYVSDWQYLRTSWWTFDVCTVTVWCTVYVTAL